MVVDSMRARFPDYLVDAVDDLQVNVKIGQTKVKCDLWNLYQQYSAEPEKLQTLISRHVSSLARAYESGIDLNRIMPVVRSKGWLSAMSDFQHEHTAINEELFMLYVIDDSESMRYVSVKEAKKLDSLVDLRLNAMLNLNRLLPKIRAIVLASGTYQLTADGDYDLSLLFIDDLWSKEHLDVRGEFVVAAPSRNMLLVTGSEDQSGQDTLASVVSLTLLYIC